MVEAGEGSEDSDSFLSDSSASFRNSSSTLKKKISILVFLGADFKNNQTTKQLNSFIWTNRKVETKLYLLPIGPKIIV